MPTFGKPSGMSASGWTAGSSTQQITTGNSAYIGLQGGAGLEVRTVDPTVCVVHEEPPKYPGWRHFLLTTLNEGSTSVVATNKGNPAPLATMTVQASGKAEVKLIFFPGERTFNAGGLIAGTMYAVGGNGNAIQSIPAAGGPAVVSGRVEGGGHTRESTPPGTYKLGPQIHVTTFSWPASTIPWGADLQIGKDGEVEYKPSGARDWLKATGPKGIVTKSNLDFDRRSGQKPDYQSANDGARAYFIANGQLAETTWKLNDFGRWGWRLFDHGRPTGYYIHTTPDDELATAQQKKIMLANSHGCIHLHPNDRDKFIAAKYLKEGMVLEVRPYTETSPYEDPTAP